MTQPADAVPAATTADAAPTTPADAPAPVDPIAAAEALLDAADGAQSAETPDAAPVDAEAEKPPETEAEKKDSLSARFAALARKEQRIVEQQRALKTERAKIEEFNKRLALAQSDPLAFLEANGLDYEKLTRAYLAKDAPATVEDKVEELRAQLAARDAAEKAAAEQRQKAEAESLRAQAIAEERQILAEMVKASSAAYPLSSEWETDEVVRVAINYRIGEHERTGKYPSREDALGFVEKELARMRARFVKEPPATAPAKPAVKAPPKTLSASMSGARTGTGPKTLAERMKEAEALLG